MKIIKNFETFNEELNPETYKSAAKKLKYSGFDKRSEDLLKHSIEMSKIYNDDYEISYYNSKNEIINTKISDLLIEINNNDTFTYIFVYDTNKKFNGYFDYVASLILNQDGSIRPAGKFLFKRKDALKISRLINDYLSDNGIKTQVNVNQLYKEKIQ